MSLINIRSFWPIFIAATLLSLLTVSCEKESPIPSKPVPEMYQEQGVFIKSLPYFNVDSCVLLIRQEVPSEWQVAAYANLILDGPEDSSLELGFEHLDAYEQNFPSDRTQAFTQYWRGGFLIYQNNYDSAQVCLNQAYEINTKLGDTKKAIEAQMSLGKVYLKQVHYPKAIRSFLKVHETVKNLDSADIRLKYRALVNLADVYHVSNNGKEALDWAQRALTLVSEGDAPNRYLQVNAQGIISTIYNSLERPDSAILAAKQALGIHQQYQTQNSMFIILSKLTNGYLANEECDQALAYVKEAAALPISKNKPMATELEKDLIRIYLCLEEWDKAAVLAQKHIESSDPLTKMHSYKYLSEIYSKKGQFQLAFDALTKNRELDKKLFDIEEMQAAGAAKLELELELEEQRAKELLQKNQIQRQGIIMTLLLTILVFVMAAFLIVRQKNRRKIAEQEKELIEAREVLHLQELHEKEYRLRNTQTSLSKTKAALEHSDKMLSIKNKFIEGLQLQIANIESNSPAPTNALPNTSLHELRILTKEDWVLFQKQFEIPFPGFIQQVKEIKPKLSPAEIRLFLLIKAGFSNIEITDTLGISQQSVWRSRIRLAKKLSLEKTADLNVFVREFE